MDPENGTLKDCFPLAAPVFFSGSMLVFSGVTYMIQDGLTTIQCKLFPLPA